MTTDTPAVFEERDMLKVVGYDLSRNAARQVSGPLMAWPR